MNPLRVIVSIGIFAALAPVVAAQAPDEDLALRARAILHKHCSQCHNGQPERRGDLSVLDHAGLAPATRPADRPFLERGKPNQSQLLQLIDDGSMPPGTLPKVPDDDRNVLRAWIAAQAPDYPKTFDDDYVLAAILENVRRLPQAERPYYRYFSLATLLKDKAPDPAFRLEPQRKAFRAAVEGMARDGSAPVQPVDPAGTVFRVDLRLAGWELKPFAAVRRADDTDVPGQPNFNLFDLILLEYPLGRYYPESTLTPELTELFLKPAGQIRPIVFVQAVWFSDELTKEPLLAVADEVRRAARNLGPDPDRGKRPRLTFKAPDDKNAILPLDATTIDEIRPELPFNVTVLTLDAQTTQPKAKTKFRPEERLIVKVGLQTMMPELEISFDVHWSSADNFRMFLNRDEEDHILRRGDVHQFAGKGNGYRVTRPVGRTLPVEEALTVFASEGKLPEGFRLMSKLIDKRPIVAQRVYHAFYPLPGAPPAGLDPGRVMKKTVFIEIDEK